MRQGIIDEVESRIDMDTLTETEKTEKAEINKLVELLGQTSER